jgi:hypothetical protein
MEGWQFCCLLLTMHDTQPLPSYEYRLSWGPFIVAFMKSRKIIQREILYP